VTVCVCIVTRLLPGEGDAGKHASKDASKDAKDEEWKWR
jgi:hypothetical protein